VLYVPSFSYTIAFLLIRADSVKIGICTGIEWSGPISFENQTKDLSILAVGHRSGEISLWRYVLSSFTHRSEQGD